MEAPVRYRSEMKVGPEGKTRVMVIDGDQGWLKSSDEVITYPPTFSIPCGSTPSRTWAPAQSSGFVPGR